MSLSPWPAKLIGFDPETLRALELLSTDSGKSLQQLADEAFVDLLAKHHRPHTFLDALYVHRPAANLAKGWNIKSLNAGRR